MGYAVLMRLTISTFGHDVLSRRIKRVEDRAEDLRPAFDEVYARFREIESIQFQMLGRGPSGPWAPLKDSTTEIKRKLGQDPRMLHNTMRLRRSLTTLRGTGGIYRRGANGIFMGSNVRYADFHQRGTKRMVARPPVDLHEQDKRELVDIIQDWIMADA